MSDRRSVHGLSFDLPMPISTNALWMPVRRGHAAALIRSSAYKNWLSEAGLMLNRQPKERIIGPYAMYLAVSVKSRADLGNCEKAVSDLLQSHGVVENDRHCVRISSSWSKSIEGMRVQLLASKGKLEAAA